MKLLRCIADKLYKYSSYNKIEAPICYVKTQNVETINCQMEVWEHKNPYIEEVKRIMVDLMANDICKYIDVEFGYDNRGKKIYRGQIKIVKE